MADNAEERLKIEEHQLTEGHVVKYTVSVPNLASLRTGRFRHDFRTACEVLSTSWKLDLVYHEVTEENELSFTVTLVRDDSKTTKVGARILVLVCDKHNCPIYLPYDFKKDEMYHGDTIQATVRRIAPLPLISIFQVQEIVVNVTMKISFCH
ncbi:hypothetical protein AVEN_171585-1 [Araneus ventricosus]|uniref:MATH domain-containing protein n=1 Tax=Araneus ventricosus TaxID=182803 RepID=A0A4Y2K5N2_ARAVE|nr:hypothetical protein AVEN_171585-1 [Araneus ventricosus]